MRLLLMLDETGKRCQPARGGIRTRGHAVVGKAVPRGQRQNRNVWGDEPKDLLEIGNTVSVRHDIGNGCSAARHICQEKRLHSGRHISNGQRRIGRCHQLHINPGDHKSGFRCLGCDRIEVRAIRGDFHEERRLEFFRDR